VARKIFFSPASASSSARTLLSRPTTNGVIMWGKITTSRIGIIGSRFVSDFSLVVIVYSYLIRAEAKRVHGSCPAGRNCPAPALLRSV